MEFEIDNTFLPKHLPLPEKIEYSEKIVECAYRSSPEFFEKWFARLPNYWHPFPFLFMAKLLADPIKFRIAGPLWQKICVYHFIKEDVFAVSAEDGYFIEIHKTDVELIPRDMYNDIVEWPATGRFVFWNIQSDFDFKHLYCIDRRFKPG